MKISSKMKKEALPHIRYEIEMLLRPFRFDRSDKAMEGIVRFRKLAAARTLYYFFITPLKNRKHDDILCEDYGFSHKPLEKDGRENIEKEFNKRLFHLTFSRILIKTPWKDQEIVELISSWTNCFVDWMIEKNKIEDSEEKKLWEQFITEKRIVLAIDNQDVQNISSNPPVGFNT